MYIVKLEKGVWADHVRSSDPGRTCVEENAQRFPTITGAARALDYALKCRPFKNSEIIPVSN